MVDQKKSVLGRGLNALIPKNPRMEVNVRDGSIGRDTGEIGIIASIDIAKIQPNPFQPRTDFDQDSLAELTRSIQEKGIMMGESFLVASFVSISILLFSTPASSITHPSFRGKTACE